MNPLFFIALAGGLYLLFSGDAGVADALTSLDSFASDDPFTQWDSLIQNESSQQEVPWRWTKAIVAVESSYGQAASVAYGISNPTDIDGSKSSDGKSWGLMQLTLPTAQQFLPGITAVDLNNPGTNVQAGTMYLASLIDDFGTGDPESVFRGYNGGPGFANTVAGQRDTPAYWAKIQAALADIMAKQPGDELEV